MKVTKQYLKKLILEELTQEMSEPTTIKEAAGGRIFLVQVTQTKPNAEKILGIYNNKEAALRDAESYHNTFKMYDVLVESVPLNVSAHEAYDDDDILRVDAIEVKHFPPAPEKPLPPAKKPSNKELDKRLALGDKVFKQRYGP